MLVGYLWASLAFVSLLQEYMNFHINLHQELQLFKGECWSDEMAAELYQSKGQASACVNEKFEPCSPRDQYCVGAPKTMFVYRVLDGNKNF